MNETGWRQDGIPGYIWTFSIAQVVSFCYGGRDKGVPDGVLGEDFAGTIGSDFYGAYDHYLGPKQRCWAHFICGETSRNW